MREVAHSRRRHSCTTIRWLDKGLRPQRQEPSSVPLRKNRRRQPGLPNQGFSQHSPEKCLAYTLNSKMALHTPAPPPHSFQRHSTTDHAWPNKWPEEIPLMIYSRLVEERKVKRSVRRIHVQESETLRAIIETEKIGELLDRSVSARRALIYPLYHDWDGNER